jgi:hypothetical protein
MISPQTAWLFIIIFWSAIAIPNSIPNYAHAQISINPTKPTSGNSPETRPEIIPEKSKNLDMNIDGDANENLNLGFDAFLQQAETLMSQSIQSEFSNFPQLERLSITVSLSRRGLVAPILTASIERSQWQNQPNLQTNRETWSRQIGRSAELLGYIIVQPLAKRSTTISPNQQSVYSPGFFKINRPSNRPTNQQIPGAFPRDFINNSSPIPPSPGIKVRVLPQNQTPTNRRESRDD